MKKQVILIEGGRTFRDYGAYLNHLKSMPISLEYLNKATWRDTLAKDLGDTFQVIRLQMPNRMNARYTEWEIYFERYLELMSNKVTVVGHSLGALFLVKFFSENNSCSHKIDKLILVAAPFGGQGSNLDVVDFSLSDERFVPPFSTTLFSSDNDPLVPQNDAVKYQELIAKLKIIDIPNRGHFSEKDFTELQSEIRG
ncbi:alpha/beta hydrolase [Candidatus Kaiserbacteria bacterium]|nr:alpha/beta hydrolase [Candidatus Kaiserbacteria bacterium]